jgi:hypothetical protein
MAGQVTELRVHGVGGASASEILGEPFPKQVAGDAVSGFFEATKSPPGRRLEAYTWGGLTSQSLASALWWLLLPFTLVNLAGWAHVPSGGDRPAVGGRATFRAIRVLVHAGAWLLTAVYGLHLAALLIDVLAWGCAGDAACAQRFWMQPFGVFGGEALWRAALGSALVFGVAGVLFQLARRSHQRGERTPHMMPIDPVPDPDAEGRDESLRELNFWFRTDRTRRAYHLHLAVMGCVAGMATGIAFDRDPVAWPAPLTARWWGVSILALAVVAWWTFLARPDREVYVDGTFVRRTGAAYLGRLLGFGALHLCAIAAGVLAGPALPRPSSPPLSNEIYEWVLVQVGIAAYVVIAALTVLALVREWRWIHPRLHGLARQFRRGLLTGDPATERLVPPPEVEGSGFRLIAAPVAMGLGHILAFSGFSAVLERVIATLGLNPPPPAPPRFVLVGGNSIVFGFALLVTVAFALVYLVLGRRGRRLQARVRADYGTTSQAPDVTRFVAAVSRARWLAETGRNFDIVLTVLALAFGVTQVAHFVAADGDLARAASPILDQAWLGAFGSWVLVLFAFPGLVILRAAARARGSRRQFAKVWDVVTFWPRRYHPLAAPCYADRAVPQLWDRIETLTSDGGRVVLAAHSQGTVLAYAALEHLAVEHPQTLDRVALVTYGSPLRQLFSSFFPMFFAPAGFASLRGRLRCWFTLYRETDYIGRHVFTHGRVDPLASPDDPLTGPDLHVPDPWKLGFPINGHSRYEQDEVFEPAIREAIRALDRPLAPVDDQGARRQVDIVP